MLKYASTEILGAEIARQGVGLMRNAHRATFHYEPKHGMLYVRSRMISSRCNDNFDEFPGDEIRQGWPTFLGKPVFVNHNNDDHRRMRGLIIDAVLHEDLNPDRTPDIWVEGLMEVDALRFPKLAKAIIAGHIDRTSMGVDVAFSVCAACGNKATTPLEYCAHIPGQKGRKLVRYEASTGQRKATLIRERCHGLRFFENSLLVEEPADPTAYFLGSVERGPGLEHLAMTRTAARNTPSPAPIRPGHHPVAPVVYAPHTGSLSKFAHGGTCPICRGTDTISVQGAAECFDCESVYPLGARAAASNDGLEQPSLRYESKYSFDTRKNPHWATDPSSHPIWHDIGASVDHIVHHYDQATDGEKRDGMRWYPDAHLLAHHLGASTGVGTHKMAGMLSAYSPQMEWSANLHHAVRSAHEGRAIGPGEGATVMSSHQNAAQKILDGEDHQTALKGSKTNAFAHTIEHGGMDPERPGHQSQRVTVDTHAVSVMCGRRLEKHEKADAASALGKPWLYHHAQSLYQQAAAHVSARDGHEIAPHQMQAVTWGVRKRINDADPTKNKGTITVERNNKTRWQEYHKENTDGEFATHSAEPGMRNMHATRRTAGRSYRTGPGRRVGAAQDDDRIRAEAAGPRYPDPADHPVFQDYAPSPKKIVAHYDDALPAEQHQGGRWFEDLHHIASAVGKHTGVGKHVAAGLFAAYSPQMEHQPALHNAVRSMHEGEPVRQGQGPYVTHQHAKSANKILQGEHHQEALGGAKSQDLAHLIEHGGRNPETGGHSARVSCGHHEFAIAAGLGYSDADTERDARKVLGNRHYYDHLAGMYHQAAQHLNERDGTSLAGHHVQATCNLSSKRMADEDAGQHEPSGQQVADRARTQKYVTERHPELGGNVHLSYGETKAPAQVDTLRDEACPVCGETEAWDGDNCMVCGFVAPPDKFQDPNVDLAKQVDLRAKDQGQLVAGDVPGLNMDTNDADGDGLDDNTGEPVDGQSPAGMGGAPMLTCPNCGFEVEGGQPVSVDTAQPQGLPNADTPEAEGPAEGDLCPACGKAPLQSAEQLVEEGELPPEADGRPDADPSEVDDKVEDDERDPSPFDKDESDPEATVDGDEEDNPEEDEDDDEDDDDDEADPKKPVRPTPGFRQ